MTRCRPTEDLSSVACAGVMSSTDSLFCSYGGVELSSRERVVLDSLMVQLGESLRRRMPLSLRLDRFAFDLELTRLEPLPPRSTGRRRRPRP